MILTCPKCATRYQTDASLFAPPGRKVRCAKCGHVWHQAANPSDTAAGPAPAQERLGPTLGSAVPRRAAYAGSSTGAAVAMAAPGAVRLEQLGVAFGWAALAGIVIVVAWSALSFRQDIANLWPQSSSFYRAVGMPVNTRGIEFRNKNARFETENGQDALVITGKLVNITSRELAVPAILVSLTDDGNRELYHWSFSSGATILRPGQSAPFQTRLPSPPPAMRHVELHFAERSH
jgi:predicted Zn finger-like uncharacterized protein